MALAQRKGSQPDAYVMQDATESKNKQAKSSESRYTDDRQTKMR